MAILGSLLFAMIFALLSPQIREWFAAALVSDGEWMNKFAPYSYVLLAVILIVPIFAVLGVFNAPKPAEPENPLARYKADDVMGD